ncbi:MAG: acyltransferase [Candidatus Bathyarchaeota archaeon]|nr:acyltransferase [Candidatus Bathyarchaeota archaeon]
MQDRGFSVPVDLVRAVAIVAVIVLHATNDATSFDPQAPFEVWRWWMVDVYQSMSRVGVPLFAMLSGVLLLSPGKEEEPLSVFFRKRWARIGLPFLFWGAIYFAWDFFSSPATFTPGFVIQGVLSGPYFHFWYLYMLIGLYLATPLLRILIAHASRKLIKYLLVVWLLGAVFVPLPALFGPYHLDVNVFVIPLWVGYFVLGLYLAKLQVRRAVLGVLLLLGLALTAVGTYFMAANYGGALTYFFQDYFSPTMILASAALFLLLNTTQKRPSQTRQPKTNWLLRKISENTLPIYLLHVIIIESLQRGYFGFTLSSNTLNSIIEVPLISIATLFICLAIILPLKQIPIIKKIIG